MRTVDVLLSDREHIVTVGAGLLGDLSHHLDLTSVEQIVVIADRGAAGHWREVLDSRFGLVVPMTVIMMPSGEETKSLEVAGGLLNQLTDLKLRRNDLVLTFGGGMVCDLGGFVASIYQRGVRVGHLPTSLLAQVDAAIGGKTGVNLKSGKNLVGTFHQPSAVVCDVEVLQTLPDREFASGIAEVLKYGLIMDAKFLDVVEEQRLAILSRDQAVLENIVATCVEFKARVVEQDEVDRGLRTILNYGHTLGHALEAVGSYHTWLHGEAISVGMVAAAHLAGEIGHLHDEDVERHIRLLELFGLPTRARFDVAHALTFLEVDKKHQGGQRWVLLKALGEAVVENVEDHTAVRRAIEKVTAA